jgi:DNA-binding XRE family transcriptional regulator
MSAMIVSEFSHVFDEVQFAIDIRAAREKRQLTQKVIGQAIGFEGGSVVLLLESAKYAHSLRIETFLHLCQLFDLHPFDYFDLQRASTLDMFKKLG